MVFSLMRFGVLKSGSPAVNPIIDLPSFLSCLTFAVMSSVIDAGIEFARADIFISNHSFSSFKSFASLSAIAKASVISSISPFKKFSSE